MRQHRAEGLVPTRCLSAGSYPWLAEGGRSAVVRAPTDRGPIERLSFGAQPSLAERASDQGSCRSLAWRLAPSKGFTMY